MITGAHSIIYSAKPDEDRAFLRDVLKLPFVDVGHGWLIFALPPAEVAVHPAQGNDGHELYLMCDDIEAFVREMDTQGHCAFTHRNARLGNPDAHHVARREHDRCLPAASCSGGRLAPSNSPGHARATRKPRCVRHDTRRPFDGRSGRAGTRDTERALSLSGFYNHVSAGGDHAVNRRVGALPSERRLSLVAVEGE
jgi:hypothetical protein